jgi:hypothetical protein
MKKFKHSFWRYVPSNDERQSFFKFVETFETQSDVVPDFQDHYCIDHILDLETGQQYIGLDEPDQYGMWKRIK